MANERLNLVAIKNDCMVAVEQIEIGNSFITRYADGTCVCVNNKGSNSTYKIVMYSPDSLNTTKFELSSDDFKLMYKEVLNQPHNLYFMIEKNEQDMTKYVHAISDALMAMHSKSKSYNGYKMRQVN